MKSMAGLARHECGTASIEYAMIAAVLSVSILAASLVLRDRIVDLYQGVGDKTNEALAVAED